MADGCFNYAKHHLTAIIFERKKKGFLLKKMDGHSRSKKRCRKFENF
jgi:hypothetical protein